MSVGSSAVHSDAKGILVQQTVITAKENEGKKYHRSRKGKIPGIYFENGLIPGVRSASGINPFSIKLWGTLKKHYKTTQTHITRQNTYGVVLRKISGWTDS